MNELEERSPCYPSAVEPGDLREQCEEKGATMKIEFKKLPPHWRYLVTKRQIREAVERHQCDVRLIQFAGTAPKPQKITSGLYTAGNLEARPVDGRWCIRFRFYAFSDGVLELAASDPSVSILDQIDRFLNEHEAATNSTETPRECILFFRVTDDVLAPGFSTKKIESSWEAFAQNTPWW